MKEPTKPYLTVPGGNSGNFIGKFYDNLLEKHENCDLIQIEDINFDKIKESRLLEIEEEKMH